MKSMSRGMTVWGVLVVMALVAFTALLLMRAVPVYLNDMKVQNALEKVATDSEMSDAGGRALYSALQRYWDIERISHLDPRDVRVVREQGGGRIFEYDYEARISLIANIDLVFYFEDSVPIGRRP